MLDEPESCNIVYPLFSSTTHFLWGEEQEEKTHTHMATNRGSIGQRNTPGARVETPNTNVIQVSI